MKVRILIIFFFIFLIQKSDAGFINGFENYQPPREVNSPVELYGTFINQEVEYPYDWGRDALIDTSYLYDFDGDYDENTGWLWVVLAPGFDSVFRIYRSTDRGIHWTLCYEFYHGIKSLYPKVGIVLGRGDSNYVYVFVLHKGLNNTGDIGGVKIKFDLSGWSDFWITWDNDTINDFSVCKDFRSNYWLYCIASNENRGGYNTKIYRSSDYGRTWDSQAGYNIYDPHIVFGTGSNLFVTWVRPTRDTVCFQRNNNYGTPGYWLELRNLHISPSRKYCPKVSPAFTTPDSWATTWVLYEIDYNNTGDMDIWYAVRSHAWGDTWRKMNILSASSLLDERVPDVKYYKSTGNIYINAAYIIYDSSYTETSYVYSRWSDANNPFDFHERNKVNDSGTQVGTLFSSKTCGPKIIYSPGAPAPGGGVLYARAGIFYLPKGLYFDAPWFPSAIEREKEYKAKILKIKTISQKEVVFQFTKEVSDIAIYNLEGRLVKSFINKDKQVIWNGKDKSGKEMPTGVYLIKFKTDKKEFTQKFIFLR
ncbi:MAG: T9SS type A sorting domain-containing protein [candidate division WOR-3 bacterium]